MVSHINDIDISKLPFDVENIKPKGIQYYKDEIKKVIKTIKEDAKKGVAVFRDDTETSYTKPSLKMDF